MKILPIIDTQRIGGPGKGLISLVKTLRTDCDIPGVVVFNRHGNGPTDFILALESNNIQPLIIYERRALDPSALVSLYKLISSHHPDVVQTHSYKANFFIFVLRCLRRIKKPTQWAAWIHGWTDENIKIKIYNLLEKTSVIFADSVVCVSKSLSKKINAHKEKVTIIPNGIDESYSSLQAPNLNELRQKLNIGDRKVIIVVGRYSFEKGQDRVPLIAAELKKLSKDKFVILLIGEGPEKENIHNLIKQHNLADNIMLHPYLADIRPFYLLADVCLLPSRKEGMPNVILEALYMRCPVVSFDVGGVTEIIEHPKEGIIVEQGNIEAAAAGIDKILRTPEIGQQLKLAGRKKVCNQFLNTSRASKVYHAYKQLQ